MTFPNKEMRMEMEKREEIRRENAARELRCALEEYECVLRRTVTDDSIEAGESLREARAAFIELLLLLGRHGS